MFNNRRFIFRDQYAVLSNYEPIEDKIRSHQWFVYLNILLMVINLVRLVIGIFDLLDIRSKCVPGLNVLDDIPCRANGLNSNDEGQMDAYVGQMITCLCIIAIMKLTANYISIRAYQTKSYWKINLIFWIYTAVVVSLLIFRASPMSIIEYMALLFGALKLRPIFKAWQQRLSELDYIDITPKLSDALILKAHNYGRSITAISTRPGSLNNMSNRQSCALSYARMDLDYPNFVKSVQCIEMETFSRPR